MEILMQQAYNELKQSQGCDFCEDNTQILSNRIQVCLLTIKYLKKLFLEKDGKSL